jgi:hypothetical protein
MTTTSSTPHCIHGFPAEQCVSCRACEHGLQFSACGRCRAPAVTRRVIEPTGDRSTQMHDGHEIFYDPKVSGWRYRATDAAASPLSYRSAFLARKAIDGRSAAGPTPGAKPTSKRRAVTA